MLIICVLILAYMFAGKDVKSLLEKIKEVDWKGYSIKTWDAIKKYSVKIGRSTCENCLKLWHVLDNPVTSLTDKAIIYAAIIYTVSPWSIISSANFSLLGCLDELAAINFAIKRVSKNITPEIEEKAKRIVEEWFGPDCSAAEA